MTASPPPTAGASTGGVHDGVVAIDNAKGENGVTKYDEADMEVLDADGGKQ